MDDGIWGWKRMDIQVKHEEQAEVLARLSESVHNLHRGWHPSIFREYNYEVTVNLFRELLSKDHVTSFIAYKGVEPVGYVILVVRYYDVPLYSQDHRSIYIDQMGVADGFQRQGIGRALMDKVQTFAQEQGIGRLELSVWVDNSEAIEFYRQMGFTDYLVNMCRDINQGGIQPKILPIDEGLRLRAYDGNYLQALPWYLDEYVYRNSEGITDPEQMPNADYVRRMYEYLAEHGELYFIEVLEDGEFVAIGDVTLKEENLPITIGIAHYRGRGIGKKVMRAILTRAKELGIAKIYGSGVYDYNVASQRLHEALGFKCVAVEGNQKIYELEL